jgi:Cytidylate kinase-like family
LHITRGKVRCARIHPPAIVSRGVAVGAMAHRAIGGVDFVPFLDACLQVGRRRRDTFAALPTNQKVFCNFSQSHGIPEQEAARVVRANDLARRRYVRAYLNSDVTDALNYDLVVNTESHGFERVARIICAAVVHLILHAREPKALHHPVQNGSRRLA